jgi:hypothetical protein
MTIRLITTSLFALGFAGAMAVGFPSTSSAQQQTIQGGAATSGQPNPSTTQAQNPKPKKGSKKGGTASSGKKGSSAPQ